MEELFKALLLAYKAEDVRKILMKIGNSKMRWEPVGNRCCFRKRMDAARATN